MAIKTRLKHWFTAIDEALLYQEDTEPIVPPYRQTQPESSPPEAPAPSVPTSTPAEKTSTRLDIPVDLQALRSRFAMQIPTPHAIAPELLRPFTQEKRELILHFPAHHKTIPAMLHAMEATCFWVDTLHSTGRHKAGEYLLAVFPVLPETRYVIQATIDAVYAGRFKLTYLDPRYDIRRQLRLAEPVQLRLVPAEVIRAIEQRQVRLMRDVYMPTTALLSPWESSATDGLFEPEHPITSPLMELLDTLPAMHGELQDISRGGSCLAMAPAFQGDALLHHLVRIHIVLRPVAARTSHTVKTPSLLTLLGVVRGVKATPEACLLHVRFLQRLPEAYDTLFTALELMSKITSH